ncbi:MAG: alpha/beta hydrolase [Acidobacteria bacterium]|nr:alpha/beta hydrolase [Acidobacteriota bacterium]MBI3425001.1 alpha/beta hydrolase [Acidobacteriota bacterium]
MKKILFCCCLTLLLALSATARDNNDLDAKVEHGYADSNGVKIHFAALGPNAAPLVVMIHGFPDFWFTWRDQMVALSKDYRVVAIDQRGYNLSDKPKGVENYDMQLLAGDVVAVVKHHKRDKAIIVGHDWGGMVAWTVAMYMPQMVERLIILNLPHPTGLSRELANNPAQQKNSQYARNFQQPDAHTKINAEGIAFWVKDPEAKKKYIEAFNRSDLEAMLNYYKRNYPREPYQENKTPLPKVQCSVLMIHGLGDTALLPGALNNTWEWLEKDLTLVTVPKAGHFVQQDASDFVSRSMKMWLAR